MDNNVTLDDKLRTVAEFSGFKHLGGQRFSSEGILFGVESETTWFIDEMKFHTSYDWLMEAWVKFRDLETDITTGQQIGRETMCHIIAEHLAYSPISKAFDALHEAIQWHNGLNKDKR